MKVVALFFTALFFLLAKDSGAQNRNSQGWIDYVVDYPWANKYLAEMELSYQKLLTHDGSWTSFNASPTFEVNILPKLDIISAIPFAYTLQSDTFNTAEARVMLGVRLYFTPNQRVEVRSTIKYEHRFFKQIGEGELQLSNRFRIRAEALVPFNKRDFYQDKMWYGIFDAELFLVVDQQVSERYANRWRARAGVGYRLSYTYRFEFIYTTQRSRNEISQPFDSDDNVFQLIFKHYLHKTQ